MPLYWPLPAWSWSAAALFAAIGLIRPFVSGQLAQAANHYLGPTISNTLGSSGPLFALAFGVVVLGEALDMPTLLGAFAIVAGVMVLSWRGDNNKTIAWWALALPLGAAFIRALAQGLTKLGYDALPSPYFAALISYTVSTALAFGLHVRMGGSIAALPGQAGLTWFVAAGAINGCAILCLNFALAYGDLILVAPLVATSPVFTVLLSWAIFRQESITRQKLVGVGLVVPGVMFIATQLA